MSQLKRAHEPATPGEDHRVLVDRLWPRGLREADAHIDEWRKDVAPSHELRRWFGHDSQRFPEFRERYPNGARDAGSRPQAAQGEGTLLVLLTLMLPGGRVRRNCCAYRSSMFRRHGGAARCLAITHAVAQLK